MHRVIRATLALTLLLPLAGCWEVRVVRNGWADLEALAAEQRPRKRSVDVPEGSELTGFGIETASFKGSSRFAKAQQVALQINQGLGFDSAWTLDRDGKATVYVGRFGSATDPMARLMLKDVQAVTVEGRQPFAEAMIVPLMSESKYDPLDAKNYVGSFTLQIGFYDGRFDGDRRTAAQEAVKSLRAQGEDAYYYHGPNMSLVTIGLFSQDDFVQQGQAGYSVESYGPRIRELQKKFRYNLANGLTLNEKDHGKDLGAQPSCLVRIF